MPKFPRILLTSLIPIILLAGCSDRNVNSQTMAQPDPTSVAVSEPVANRSIVALSCVTDQCPYITEVYNSDPVFQEAFKLAISQVGVEQPEWYPNGVHTPVTPIAVGQTKLIWGSVCEPHNCGNQIVVAYAPIEKRVGGLIPKGDGFIWFGSLLESERSALCVANEFACSLADLAVVANPTATPAQRQWWTPQIGRQKCISGLSPANRIEALSGFSDRPEVNETRNLSGELTKVTVSISEDGGVTRSTWAYYTSSTDCEREEVNDTKALADRYR